MSTKIKDKIGILSLLSQMFGENDFEETDKDELPEDLKDTLVALEKSENNVEISLTTADKKSSSNKSGIKKVNPKTEAAMRATYKKIKTEEGIDMEIL